MDTILLQTTRLQHSNNGTNLSLLYILLPPILFLFFRTKIVIAVGLSNHACLNFTNKMGSLDRA